MPARDPDGWQDPRNRGRGDYGVPRQPSGQHNLALLGQVEANDVQRDRGVLQQLELDVAPHELPQPRVRDQMVAGAAQPADDRAHV